MTVDVRPSGGRHRALIVWLTLGVPFGYAVSQLFGGRGTTLLYASLGLAFLHMLFSDMAQSLAESAHRHYLALLLLLCVPLAGLALDGSGRFRAAVAALVTCAIWTSVFFTLFRAIRNRRDAVWAHRLLVTGAAIASASVYLSAVLRVRFGYAFGEVVDVYGQFRAFGPLGDQVGFVIALFLVLAYLQRRWLLASFHGGALILTGTRGAAIVVLVGVIASLVIARRGPEPWQARSNKSASRVLATGALVLVLAGTPVVNLAYVQYTDASRGSGLQQRRAPVAFGLQVFADNPLVGIGYLETSFASVERGADRYFLAGTDVERATYTVQNQYVQTAVDGGIVGLVGLLGLLRSILRRVSSVRRLAGGYDKVLLRQLQIALFSFIVGNQSAAWFLPSAASGYFLFALAAVALRIANVAEQEASDMDRRDWRAQRA